MSRRPQPRPPPSNKKRRSAPSGRGGRSERGSERPLREDQVTQACLAAYGAVRHEGRLADRALDFTLRQRRHLFSTERRAVAERVYALLRRQRTVDWLLARARPDFERLPTSQADLLRVAAARVLEGERPDAVARSMALLPPDARTVQAIPEARRALAELPPDARFPIEASLPDWLAEKLVREWGDEAWEATAAMNERAPLIARVNTLKTDRERLIFLLREEGVDCRPCALSPLGVILETRINAFSLKAFREGLFELQDEGSQLLGMLVDPPPTKVVDACAGAGGKTLQLAAEMRNRGELFALDVDPGRLDELRRRARRDGVHNTRVRPIPASGQEALEAVADLSEKADRVMVDAPCSGTGTFRRKPDARYRLTPEDLVMHVQRQRELLARFSRMVKPGGRLIYGTCSVLRDENEEVIEDFLSRHPDFSVRPVETVLPQGVGEQVSRGGFLRLFPHRHHTDGFFGAILQRAPAPRPGLG